MPRVDTHNVPRRGFSTYGFDITCQAYAPYNGSGRVPFYTFIGLLATAGFVSFVSPRTRVGWPEEGCTRSGQLQSIQNGSHHRRNSTIDTRSRFIITSLLLCVFLLLFVLFPFPFPIPDTPLRVLVSIYNSYNRVHPFSPAYVQPRFFHEPSSCPHFVNTIGPRPKACALLGPNGADAVKAES